MSKSEILLLIDKYQKYLDDTNDTYKNILNLDPHYNNPIMNSLIMCLNSIIKDLKLLIE